MARTLSPFFYIFNQILDIYFCKKKLTHLSGHPLINDVNFSPSYSRKFLLKNQNKITIILKYKQLFFL